MSESLMGEAEAALADELQRNAAVLTKHINQARVELAEVRSAWKRDIDKGREARAEVERMKVEVGRLGNSLFVAEMGETEAKAESEQRARHGADLRAALAAADGRNEAFRAEVERLKAEVERLREMEARWTDEGIDAIAGMQEAQREVERLRAALTAACLRCGDGVLSCELGGMCWECSRREVGR